MDSKKTVLLIVLGFGITAMTIAFAALSTNLRISGTASVPSTTWNIHFQNWAVDTASTVTVGSNIQQNTAVYPSISTLENSMSLKPNVTKVENIDVTLYQPGDYAKYTFQIINEGSIDASLDNFEKALTCASGEDCSHISYTVECTDLPNSGGNNVLIGHPTLAKNGGLAYCTLEVKYLDQTNQNSNSAGSVQTYNQSAAHATLNATWVYVQEIDSNSNSGNSGGNEQGNNSGNEPSGGSETPVVQTWDLFYYYDESKGKRSTATTQDSSWPVWGRENTTSGVRELCVDTTAGEKCMKYYTQEQLAEIITCDVYNVCTASGELGEKLQSLIDLGANCTIGQSGYSCFKGNSYWNLSSSMLYCGNDDYWIYCVIGANGNMYCTQ